MFGFADLPPPEILCLLCPSEPQSTNLYSTYQHTDCNQTEKARHRQHEHRIPIVALKADLTKGICIESTFQYEINDQSPICNRFYYQLDSLVVTVILHRKQKHSRSQMSHNRNRSGLLDIPIMVLNQDVNTAKKSIISWKYVLQLITMKKAIFHTHKILCKACLK